MDESLIGKSATAVTTVKDTNTAKNVIGKGTHTRFVIDTARFMAKLQ